MALFTRSRDADQAGELLLGDRDLEGVPVAGDLQQMFGGPTGHIEEERICQRLVHGPEPTCEQRDDLPQQFGTVGPRPGGACRE